MSYTDAKNEILAAIRSGKPDPLPEPEIPVYDWPGDPLENFIESLLSFDGKAALFKTRDDAIAWLKAQRDLGRAYSSAQGFEGGVTDADLADLRKAADVESCVTEGVMGVGEMGSIWVTDKSLKRAPAALLCERLIILLDKEKIAGSLSEAYERINIKDNQYGAFYAGPSATADIEAVRVTGAQGPLSLTALIYNCPDAPDSWRLLEKEA